MPETLGRGDVASRILRAAIGGTGFPPGIPDTPATRQQWDDVQRDIDSLPAGVMPDVPYDYNDEPEPPVEKAASDPGDPNPVEAEHVYNQMLANYPPKAIGWIKDARWIGPVAVDPDRVDTDDEDSWAASHQPARIKHFVKKLTKDKVVKPGVCVQEPGQQTVKVIDGHHRFLAARKAGKPYMAYVGFVDQDSGPWDETHSSQFHSGADPKNKSAQTAELSTVHKPLGTHGLWGDESAQLPAYIQNIAHALQRDGHDESSAIQIAIGTVKRWAAGGGKVTPEVRAAAAGALAEWEKLKAEHSKTKSAVTPDIGKVGPHGYIHGWVFVGVPGMGDEVRHPEHGKGSIISHDAKHVSVRFHKKGVTHTFAVHRAPNEQGHFTKRGDLEHELGHPVGGGEHVHAPEPPKPEEPAVSPKIAKQNELGKRVFDDPKSVGSMSDDDLADAKIGLNRHRLALSPSRADNDRGMHAADALFDERMSRDDYRRHARVFNDTPGDEKHFSDAQILNVMRHAVREGREQKVFDPDLIAGHRVARIELDRRVRESQARNDPKDWTVDRLQIHGGTPKQQQRVLDHLRMLTADMPPEKMAKLSWVRITDPKDAANDMSETAAADYRPVVGAGELRVAIGGLDKAATDAQMHDLQNRGWWSKTNHTDGLRSTIDHELGHHLDYQLTPEERNEMFGELAAFLHPQPGEGLRIRNAVVDNGDKIDPENLVNGGKAKIIQNVGTYAATNHKELVAELWAQYHGNKIVGNDPLLEAKSAQIIGHYLAGHKTPYTTAIKGNS